MDKNHTVVFLQKGNRSGQIMLSSEPSVVDPVTDALAAAIYHVMEQLGQKVYTVYAFRLRDIPDCGNLQSVSGRLILYGKNLLSDIS